MGPGDRHKPFESLKCQHCHQKRRYDAIRDEYVCACIGHHRRHYGPEDAQKWDAGRYPMETQVGDRVAYPRRPSSPVGTSPRSTQGGDSSLTIDGETFLLFHEEQNCLAILTND